MKRRIFSLLLACTLFAALLPSAATGARAAEYTQEQIEGRLASVIEAYDGTYWYGSYAGGIQCKGFADLVFNALFGTGYAGCYDAYAYYYLTNPQHCHLVGQLAPGYSAGVEADVAALRALLVQAAPGDYLQMRRTNRDYGHTMIVVRVSADGLTVLDCNLAASCKVAVTFHSWQYMTRISDGISLYRHDGYTPDVNYTLTYDANGGTGAPEAVTLSTGSDNAFSATEPVREGYRFLGWAEKPFAQDASYQPGGDCLFDENTTLYAVWTADRCDFTDGAVVGERCGDGIYGDLDGDGAVTAQDLSIFNAVCNGEQVSDTCCWERSDLNGDGRTDADDGLLLCAYVRDELALLGHCYVLTDQTEATMDTPDTKTYTCSRCGAEYRVTGMTLLARTMAGFTDLIPTQWYYSGICFAVGKGLMAGMSASCFGPDEPVTRAMLVTILYRASGDTGTYDVTFSDVPAGQYYAKAVAWAAACGVTAGTGGGCFSPGRSITREQTAALLYRYAVRCGMDTTQRGNLTGYSDAAQISDYALDALRWANGAGILSGRSDTSIAPKGTATRAELAIMLCRFFGGIPEKAAVPETLLRSASAAGALRNAVGRKTV